MATLQVLRKRYKSIQATADMASALKTASSVKYARISRELANIEPYSIACDQTLSMFGEEVLTRNTESVQPRNCLVLLSNDRGFCGGFNSELLRFFEEKMNDEPAAPLLLVFGQKGVVFCRNHGFEFESLPLRDIPTYQDAEELTARLFGLYENGEAEKVEIVYQKFVNMMVQRPTLDTILPHAADERAVTTVDLLFLPDRKTALQSPAMYCLTNSIYRLLLEHCAGIQAATTIAMRSACDNAQTSLEKLEILINRIRQAEVTNSVIETSSFLAGQ